MELFYRKEGSGSPVVIVHGLYGSSDNWLSIGKRLSQKHTVYMIDRLLLIRIPTTTCETTWKNSLNNNKSKKPF